MPQQIIMSPTAVEDLTRHNPVDSFVQQTITRAKYPSGTEVVNRLSAASFPLLDTPLVSGARRPFYELGLASPTRLNLTIELALQLLRKSIPHFLNFEGMGGTPNDSTDAAAQKNREVWDKCIDIITTENRGRGIYFPTADWYFKRPAGDVGTVILPVYKFGTGIATPANIVIIGEGKGARILAAPTAGAAEDLIVFDRRGGTVADITVDKVTTTGASDGSCIKFIGDGATTVLYPTVVRVTVDHGGFGIELDGNGTTMRNAFIGELIATNQVVESIYFQNMAGIFITDATLFDGEGIKGLAGATGQALSDLFLIGCRMFTTGAIQLSVAGGATFDSAIHGRLKLDSIRLPGTVTASNLDQVEFDKIVSDVGITYILNKAGVGFSKFRARNCQVRLAPASGCEVSVSSSATLSQLDIVGGAYERSQEHGVKLVTGGTALIRGGRISGVDAYENSQGGGVHDGITLDSSAGGAIRGIMMYGNSCVDAQGVPTQRYGISEVGAGTNYNIVGHNYFEGNVTAPHLVIGAQSVLDVNAQFP